MATRKSAAKTPAAKSTETSSAQRFLDRKKTLEKAAAKAAKPPAKATRPRTRRAVKQNDDLKAVENQAKQELKTNTEELKTDTKDLKEDLGKAADSVKQTTSDVGSAIVGKTGQVLQETKRLLTPGPDEVSLDSRTRRADDVKKNYHKGLFQGAIGMLAATMVGGMIGDMLARRRNRY